MGGGDVGGGVWIVGGSLVLERADTSHAGQYSCMANNTAGQARMPVHLQVIVPLSVQVSPKVSVLSLRSVERRVTILLDSWNLSVH